MKIKIRWQFLAAILPLTIIPLIMVILITTNMIFSYLTNNNRVFYSELIHQVANNINFVYTNYVVAATNLTKHPDFHFAINASPYKNEIEEGHISSTARGDSLTVGKIYNLTEQIDANIFIYEMNRRSLLDKTPYKIHYGSNSSNIPPDYLRMISDPLFLKLKNNNRMKHIFGKFQPGVVPGSEGYKKPVFIIPYYKIPPEKPEDTFDTFIIILLNADFIPDFYRDITRIKNGTLYILDSNDNIISYNHPDSDDYYEFDEEAGNYVLGSDNPDDPDEELSFDEYQRLNTDPKILEEPLVKKIRAFLNTEFLESLDDGGYSIFQKNYTVQYKNVLYQMIVEYSSKSETKYFYFHPVSHIHKLINQLIFVIILITLSVVLIVFVFTFIYSNLFTRPIRTLADAAGAISRGDYSRIVNTRKFSGECDDLGSTFNHMSKTIHDYNLHLEDMVKKRTNEVMEANRKMKKDLEMAQKIQMKLIPENVHLHRNIQYQGLYYPMEDLGGDLYDIFKLDDDRIGMFIIDVCGHGVSAAFITTMAKVSFNNHSKRPGLTPGDVVKLVNNEMNGIIGDPGTFLTCIYAIANTRTLELSYTNCGHNDAIILSENGAIIRLAPNAPVVGVMPDLEFETLVKPMTKNDLLVLYTDGIIEARNPERDLFGLDFLVSILKENQGKPIQELPDHILSKVFTFCNHTKQDDDMTILTMKFI